MRYLSFCLVLGIAATSAAQTPSGKAPDKVVREPITMTGCVSAGTAPNTYVLTNLLRADKPVGTSGSLEPTAVYWFDPPSKLKPYVGQQVQISGILDDNVTTTKVKEKEKEGKVALKRGSHKVEVPEGTRAADAAGPPETKRLSYKVQIQSVKMLSGSCAQ